MSDDKQQDAASEPEKQPESISEPVQRMEGLPPLAIPQENFGEGFQEISEPMPGYATPGYYATPLVQGGGTPEFPRTAYGQLAQMSTPPPGYQQIPPRGQQQDWRTIRPADPVPFGQAVRQFPKQWWRVLTNPRAATFAYEQGKATWGLVWMQQYILSAVHGLFILLIYFLLWLLFQFIFTSIISRPGAPVDFLFFFNSIYWTVTTIVVIFTIALGPLFFFVSAGIYYLLAKAFGGNGSFLTHCYCTSIISVPIGITTILLALIPGVSLAAAVYEVILRIFMTMAVHRVSGGKASAAVLIPVGVAWLFVIGFYVAYYIFIFSFLRSFPTMPRNFMVPSMMGLVNF